MAVGDADGLTNGHRLVFAALALAGIAAMFLVGANLVIEHVGLDGEAPFALYAGAFTLGAWATVAAVFVANAVCQRLYGEQAIALRFPPGDVGDEE